MGSPLYDTIQNLTCSGELEPSAEAAAAAAVEDTKAGRIIFNRDVGGPGCVRVRGRFGDCIGSRFYG